ncbi:MAG: amidase [Acidobacteriota bacterium]
MKKKDLSSTTISRRGFLYGSTIPPLAAVGLSGCRFNQKTSGGPPEKDYSFELDEISIREIAQGLQDGKYSSEDITRLYLERIEALDHQGPELHSIIETNPDALQIARELDREMKEKGPRSPLHGIPVVVKDNIDTHDGMTTTAGSLALEGSIPARDSEVARRLKEAGAIILAKANLSEWANFRSFTSSSGWSARGGQCRNPYILDRNPCGSSSGSAVSVSANLCPIAIGTETNGSILCPSNANGVVGIKPTVGLVSRRGIVPISHNQDTAGPMARTVADAAALLNIISGTDPEDTFTREAETKGQPDYTEFLNPKGLKGKRLGVAREFFDFHPKVEAVMETALADLVKLGAVLVDPVEFPDNEGLGKASFNVLLYDFRVDLEEYLRGLPGENKPRTLAELIEFNETNRDREMPWFEQEIFLEAQKTEEVSEADYQKDLKKLQDFYRTKGIDKLMDEHSLDAIIAPSGGPAWTIEVLYGDHGGGGSSSPAARAGYPNITVPAGFVHGLPVGISFFGRAWSEPLLIESAYAYEQGTGHRKPPEFLPSLEW